MNIEIIAKHIVDAAYQVHCYLGPGLMESTYQFCLKEEFRIRKLEFITELLMPVEYKGKVLEESYRLDVLVEDKIIIELKSVETLLPVHTAQLITYLRLSEKNLGFLINFNVPRIKDGIKRVVYNYPT